MEGKANVNPSNSELRCVHNTTPGRSLRIVNLNKGGPDFIKESQNGHITPGEVTNAARILYEQMGFDIHIVWNNETPKYVLGKFRGLIFHILGFPLTLNNLRFVVDASRGHDIVCANADTWMYQLGVVRALGGLQNVRIAAVSYGLVERLQQQTPAQLLLAVKVLNKLDAIVVHSKFELEDLQALGLKNTVYIAYGVDTDFWKPTAPYSKGEFVFSPGTHPRRDWWTLIHSCEYPLTLASMKHPVEQRMLPDNVQLASFVRGDFSVVQHLFDRARCVAVPLCESRAIAGESAVLQAMAMRRPVIVSKTQGSSPDIVKDGETCFCVPPGDRDALRDVLRQVWKGGSRVDAIARRGQEIVFEQYNAARYAADWANLFMGL